VKYPDNHAVLYRLDAVGNRTGERETSTTAVVPALNEAAFSSVAPADLTHDITGTFDAVNWLRSRTDALDPSRSAIFAYDLNGNLVQKTATGYARELRWDVRNTLTAVLEHGAELGRYDYCYTGLRVKRSAQGQQVEYVLDDKFVLSEHDGSVATHSMRRRYHYGSAPLADSEVSGASRFTTWFNLDVQGSVTDATQNDGAVRTARQYDAWGQYRNGTAPAFADPKLGYTGHQFDPESGLIYARARYYDPDLGLFVSADPREAPVGEAPWLHRYAYAKDNPEKYADPDGLEDKPAQSQSYAQDISGIDDETLRAHVRAEHDFYSLESAQGALESLSHEQLVYAACGTIGGCNYDNTAYLLERGRRLLGNAYDTAAQRLAGVPALQRVRHDVAIIKESYDAALDSVKETTQGAVYNAIDPKGDTGSKFARKLGEAAGAVTEIIVDQAVQTAVAEGTGALAGKALSAEVKGELRAEVNAAEETAKLKPYSGPGGGHHVPARKAFEGAAAYDVNAALAIPNAELERLGVKHSQVTGAQASMYRAFSKTGEALTWQQVSRIEAAALVAGGMDPKLATATVGAAIKSLRDAGVAGPTRIPWGG
jgi:RHS repeat-associated protein